MNQEILTYNLKKIRKERRITQNDMAKMLKIKPSTYGEYERGKISLSIDKIEKIANILKTTPQYLLGWDDEYVIENYKFDNKIEIIKKIIINENFTDEDFDEINNYLNYIIYIKKKGLIILTMDNYAIYLRKSRADEELEKEGKYETLSKHNKILCDLAKKHNLHVVKTYKEIVSGETIESRPKIKELIKDCYNGLYKGIIVVEITRLSRGNQGDAQIIMDMLKYSNNNNGVLIITPTKIYDVSHNLEDEEYMEFELFMSRREYKMIKKRMERGKIQSIIEGNYMGSYRPYGYDIFKNKKTRTLIPNKEEAPIVKKIYDLYLHGNMSPGKIARKLDEMTIPTYTGAPEWSVSTIKTILTNPTYAGKIRWNDRMKIKTMINGEIKSSRPRSNHTEHYMLYDGKHEAIISEEDFIKASSRFCSDKTKFNYNLKNPLAGLLKCSKCQKVMQFQEYKNKPNTSPRYIHKPSNICKVKSANADEVIKSLVYSLKLHIEDFELEIKNLSEDKEKIINEKNILNNEITKIENKLSKLFDAWENDIISDEEFSKRKDMNNNRLNYLKNKKNSINNERKIKEYEEKIIKFTNVLDMILDKNINVNLKNEYLKQIIDKIEFSRKNNDEFILDIFLKKD